MQAACVAAAAALRQVARDLGIRTERVFVRNFGVSAIVWAVVYVRCRTVLPTLRAEHVLYAAHLVKSDPNWDAAGRFFRRDPNTVNNWAWRVILAIPQVLSHAVRVGGVCVRAQCGCVLRSTVADRLPA